MCTLLAIAVGATLCSANPDLQPIASQVLFHQVARRYLENDLKENDWKRLRTVAQKALRELEKGASSAKGSAGLQAKLLALKAAANLEIGDKGRARTDFERATQLDDTLFVCLNNAGVLNFEVRNYVRAVDFFADAAECLLNSAELVQLKPFCDATSPRSDGRTCFETIVDNLAEGLWSYELYQRQHPKRALPRKVLRARQVLEHLESALQQARAPMLRWGTSWVTQNQFARLERQCESKDREIRNAASQINRLREKGERAWRDARYHANRQMYEPWTSRRGLYWRRQMDAEARARQLQQQWQNARERLRELQADRDRLGPVFAGKCSLLALEDAPSFFRGMGERQQDATPSKQAWRQLRVGMTAHEVRRLVGEPERITTRRGATVWRYRGDGEVRFDNGNMRVKEWDEPSDLLAEMQTWRQLHVGMTTLKVRELLGEPERITVGRAAVYWRYGDSGEVRFGRNTMTVEGWDEPGGPPRIQRRPPR